MNQGIVHLKNISKSFSGVKALKNISFSINKGEIKGLVGENGAGKSTMIKILAGAHQKDTGSIVVDGENVTNFSPKESLKKGISVIYQEFVLAPHLSVAENIFLDRLSQGNMKGLLHRKKIINDTKDLLRDIGFEDIDPLESVGSLTVAYQQVVEICKALSRDAKVLILDEPTAVLTFREVKKLFNILNRLKERGIAIIYISHRLDEIFELCDKVFVMKDGEKVSEYDIDDVDEEQLVKDMVGRDLSTLYPERISQIGDVLLSVDNLNAGRQVQNVSFNVRKGEVVGFFGLVGAGRTETMKSLFGDRPKDDGTITLNGKIIDIHSAHDAVTKKVGMVPEDRKNEGVLLDLSILTNTTLSNIKGFAKYGFINKKHEEVSAESTLSKLQTKYANINNPVSYLSGGNQQKVSLGKWLSSGCDCLILDEPTRGVDVGAKVEIYNNINELASEGFAIVFISSEIQEIINMCDRAYIMREGKITKELPRSSLEEERIVAIAMGVES